MGLPKGLSIVDVHGLSVGKLYKTNIVIVNQNLGDIQLNSGGWMTKHTKKCMNLMLNEYGYNVSQRDFKWYITDTAGNKIEYFDGIKIKFAA